MSLYKNVLLALELAPETDTQLIQKAQDIVQKCNAQLTLLHVVEHMVSFGAAYSMPAGIEIEEELIKAAKEAMQDLGRQLAVPLNQQIVKSGAAKQVIDAEAKNLGVDLIIVGSHGRHGVRLLLGSTANAILHGAHCDVLAVRIKE